MGLQLYNTLTRTTEKFSSLSNTVRMYCCGPTVYDFGHIGNFRTFVFADLVRRYLEFKGYAVEHVMNITDVDDKIIKRCQDPAKTRTGSGQNALRDYTAPFEEAFLQDMQSLNCRKPTRMPRATEHIGEIVALIEKLMEKGIAYRTPDGSVYFSIEKYQGNQHRYGQLVKLNFEQMRPGARVQSDEYSKEAIADFALWKARVPEDGNVFWPSPWGEGRPGWHIECSAMSMKYLGPSFDLHLGGEDLIFPHHEDEIAQSEGATGKPFVRHWLHGAHLLVEGKKMSKSLGNFYTLRDLLGKGFTGRDIRQLLLSAHYRETFNFTMDGLQAAKQSVARLDECFAKVREIAEEFNGNPMLAYRIAGQFSDAMDDDLNVSAAWAVVFEWVRELNRSMAANELTPERAATSLRTWEWLDSVLGIGSKPVASDIPSDILALMERREAARKARDFKTSDALRDELKAKGWLIEDTPKGPRLKKC